MAGKKEPKTIAKHARFLLGGAAGLLPAESRGYTSIFNALFRISTEEGVLALWTNMKVINGKPEYSRNLDVFFTVVRREGVLSRWKGFTPHTVLTFIFLEQMTAMYRKIVLGEEGGGPSSL
ncbi:hypothetical protein NP493_403g04023 [Ridgeia piscesae]|uniref:Uncharacterized protein n=1 Tax=Ridgeia piscesae TaxID=27915 RepID=A0AAD9L243_RIDPI|nr:hypothetical protein NP493_403g04023 [Ridgeia piscesae]